MGARPEGVGLTTQTEVDVIMPHTEREQGSAGWGEVPLTITGKEAGRAFMYLDSQARSEAYRACAPDTADETSRYYRDLAEDLGSCVLRSARLQPEAPKRAPLHIAA